MNKIDITVALEVLEELRREFDFETDEYADVSQTIYYLEERK